MGIRRTFFLVLLPLAILILAFVVFILKVEFGLLAFAVSFIVSTLIILIFFRVEEVPGYDRLIISRGGMFIDTHRQGGRAFLIRGLEKPIRIDLRPRGEEVTDDLCFTEEGIGIRINYFFLWKVVDPMRYLLGPGDLPAIMKGIASAMLKTEVGELPLEDVLMRIDRIGTKMRDYLQKSVEAKAWGIEFITIELGSIKVPPRIEAILEQKMVLAMAVPNPFMPGRSFVSGNPFVAGPPLSAGSPLFVGRKHILKEITEHLAAGRGTVAEALPKPALVLYGQRRMGKSSILLQLPVRLPEDYIPVYVDLRGMAAQGTAGLLQGLAGAVAKTLVTKELPMPAVASLEDFVPEPFGAFNAFLDGVEASIGTRRVALLLDEFEWLQEKVDDGIISRDIFGYLSSAIKLRPRLFLVFAGLHSLEQMRREYWTAFLSGNSVGIHVSYLSQAEAGRLLGMLPVDTSPRVQQHICLATGCQPYLLQVICYRLMEYIHTREPLPEEASVCDVTAVLDVILEKGDADYYFEDYVWRYSTPAEREALVALARPGRQGGPPLQEEALRSLEHREILTQRRDGTWRYRVELVRRWVARKAREVTTTADILKGLPLW